MEYVYFGFEFEKAAPEMFGHLTEAPATKWVTIADVAKAIERGEEVRVRPASATELHRAHKAIALREVSRQLAATTAELLDAHGMEEIDIAAALTRLRETLEDMKAPAVIVNHVLDEEVSHGPA